MKFKFDNKGTAEIQALVDDFTRKLGEKLGFEAGRASARYQKDGSGCKISFALSAVSEDGVAQTPGVKAFYRLVEDQTKFPNVCPVQGLKREHLGGEFTHNGERYAICGYNSRAKRYPLDVKNVNNGKLYKFGLSALAKLDGVTVDRDKGTAWVA
jgi:hypothetical protein